MKKPIPLTLKLYNQVAKFRFEKEFPQATLAERVEISRSTLFRIEKGEIIPSILVALRLAKYLQTPVEKLFLLEEPKILSPEEEFKAWSEEVNKEIELELGSHD